MFLLLFSSLSSCENFIFTDENFTESLLKRDRKPIAVKLWASWCNHCKEFEPTWQSFIKMEHTFDTGEIECESNRKSCKNFTNIGFPQILWFDNNQQNNELTYGSFNGRKTVESLVEFCDKQKHFPLRIITKEEKENLTNSETTKFFFTVHESSQKVLDAAKSVAMHYRNEMCEFYIIYSNDEEEKLETSNKDNETTLFKGDLMNVEEIKYFVYVHMFHYFSQLTQRYAAFAIEQKQPFLSYIGTKEEFSDEKQKMIVDTLNELADHIPVFYTNCTQFEFLCRYTSTFKEEKTEKYTNRLVVWHKTKGIFWTKEDIYNKTETLDWLNDVLLEKIKGKGPGKGMFSKILAQVWESYGDGPGSFAMTISLPFIIAFCIYLMISSNLPDRENKIKNE